MAMHSEFWNQIHVIRDNRPNNIMSFKPLVDFKLRNLGSKYYSLGLITMNHCKNESKESKTAEEMFFVSFCNRNGPMLYDSFYDYITTNIPYALGSVHVSLYWQARNKQFYNVKYPKQVRPASTRFVNMFCL